MSKDTQSWVPRAVVPRAGVPRAGVPTSGVSRPGVWVPRPVVPRLKEKACLMLGIIKAGRKDSLSRALSVVDKKQKLQRHVSRVDN